MRKRILFLMVHLDYGGAEVGLLTTLKNIDRERFDCRVLSIEKRGRIGGQIEKEGFEVIYMNENARLYNLPLVFKIVNVLKRYKPDILHTSLFYANFFGRVASLFNRPHAIITEERSMYTEKRFYHIMLDRLLSRLTDKIIVCSKAVLDFTIKQEGIDPEKFYLIYNAVDADRFNIIQTKDALRAGYGFDGGDFIVGTVGSVIPKKGHKILIEAAAELNKRIPSLKIIIVGDGQGRQGLEKMVSGAGLKNKVIFLGSRNDIPELMRTMDVFALPSFQEGFPRTLIEAMYMSLPVVASEVSGIPEIVSDGVNGLLVAPGDTQGLTEKIFMLYESAKLRDSLGIQARKKVESGYMPENYARRLEQLYSVLTTRGPQ